MKKQPSTCGQDQADISMLGARRCGAYVLDILLSVQQQAKDDTQEMLDAFGGRMLLDVLLELDRTEMRQRSGHNTVKSLAKHDNEL